VLDLVIVHQAVLVVELPELMVADQTLELVDHKAQAVLVEMQWVVLLTDRHYRVVLLGLLVMLAAAVEVVVAIGVEAQVLTEIVLRVTQVAVVVLGTSSLAQ